MNASAARMPAKTFRDLVVWQKAHEFVLGVYQYSAGFPRSEAYGLDVSITARGDIDRRQHS